MDLTCCSVIVHVSTFAMCSLTGNRRVNWPASTSAQALVNNTPGLLVLHSNFGAAVMEEAA